MSNYKLDKAMGNCRVSRVSPKEAWKFDGSGTYKTRGFEIDDPVELGKLIKASSRSLSSLVANKPADQLLQIIEICIDSLVSGARSRGRRVVFTCHADNHMSIMGDRNTTREPRESKSKKS